MTHAHANDKYPSWRQRWEEKLEDIDKHIEGWWGRTRANVRGADTPGEKLHAAGTEAVRAANAVGDTLAGRDDLQTKTERAGDTARTWWADVRNSMHDRFTRAVDSEQVRTEISRAWSDDNYLAERFEDRAAELRRQGRIK